MCAKLRGSLYHFYDGLWYDPAGVQINDLRTVWEADKFTTKPTRRGMFLEHSA